jgi:hypothetical protein
MFGFSAGRHWRPLPVPSAVLAELRALTRDRPRLLANQQTVESQLRAILDAYHPAPVRLFSSMDCQIALAFVQDYPTPAIASRVRTARMQGFLTRHGYSGRTPAQTLAERVRDNLLSGSEGTVSGKDVLRHDVRSAVGVAQRQLSDYEKRDRGHARRATRRAHLRQLPRCRPRVERRPAGRDG